MSTIFKYETAKIAIYLSGIALLFSFGGLIISYLTYYQNFIAVNPKLSVRFDMDGLRDMTPLGDGEGGTIIGKFFLYNNGNKAIVMQSITPVLIPVDLTDKRVNKAVFQYTALEDIKQLVNQVNQSHLSASSLRYDPDISKTDVQIPFIKASEYLSVAWSAPIFFTTPKSTTLQTGSDFIWALRFVVYTNNNTAIVRTMPGSIIHYSGPKPGGIIDQTCFQGNYPFLAHDVM